MITAALFLLLIATSAKAEAGNVITSVSGTKVPLHFIQKHYNKQLVHHDLTTNVLYELIDNKVLQGHGLYLDLHNEAIPAKFNSSPQSFTVFLNGKLKGATSEKVKTVYARGYDVIAEEDSGKVLSVTGNGIALTPLHPIYFPGIFVNKKAFTTHDVDLSDDVEYPPDVLNEDMGNGTETVGNTASRQSVGSCASGTIHYVEIAAAYDNTFCALYDDRESAATAALQSVFEKTNVAYAQNTCVQLALTHVEAHCQDSSDPYASLNGSPAAVILNGFRDIWRNSRDNVERDAAYFFSGFEDPSSVAGRAAIAAACSNLFGYGWVEGPSERIFAHEVGHTLSGRHTTEGIMRGVLSSSTPFRFSDVSVQEFTNYIDNDSRSGCIETNRPSSLPNQADPSPSASPRPSRSPTSSPTRTPSPTTAPRETPSSSPPALASPSPSEEVLPVIPPSPSPLPVSPSEQICESGFSKSRALICRRRRLGQTTIRSSGTFLGQLQVFFRQRNAEFQMNYVTTDTLIITEYRDLVTTDRQLLNEDGNTPFTSVGGDAQSVETTWEANTMPKPEGTETCCSQNLYIRVTLTICRRESGSQGCGRISGTFNTSIRCGDVCRGNPNGVFVPMSASQACPSCQQTN